MHQLPTWISNKGKPKRIIAPLPVPPKPTPSKPTRGQASHVGVEVRAGERKIKTASIGQPKVVRRKPGKVVLIRKNGKLYVPRHLKEQFLRERGMSDSTMKSISTVTTQQPSPVSTLKNKKQQQQEQQLQQQSPTSTASKSKKKVLDPSKPMSRQDQIEFIKQQTKLAKKVALRPHIAESEVRNR